MTKPVVAHEVRVEALGITTWLVVPEASPIRALARAQDDFDGDQYVLTGTTFLSTPISTTQVVWQRPTPMTNHDPTYDLQRTRELLTSARRTCEDRTRKRDQARAVLARQAEAAAVGAAVLGLLEQIHRLRRTPCPTMGFGFSPAEIAEAVLSEVFEVKAEQPGSSRAQHETVGVLATALHLTIAHDTSLLDGLLAETARLRARLDHVDRGGTWKEAKTLETERELTPPCTD